MMLHKKASFRGVSIICGNFIDKKSLDLKLSL